MRKSIITFALATLVASPAAFAGDGEEGSLWSELANLVGEVIEFVLPDDPSEDDAEDLPEILPITDPIG